MQPPAWDEDRLFGRRQDKPLRARQRTLLEDVLPKWSVDPTTVNDAISNHDGPVWLEVGFGGGEHLAWQAEQNPDTLMIGAEPFINGVVKLITQVHERGIQNARIRHGDVRPLITAMPAQSVERMFVLHPDPWPKRRHFKRRMISPSFLTEAARLLKPGSVLRVSSDIPDYVRWTLMQVQLHNRQSNDFQWTAKSRQDWSDRPVDWPQTRYEAKALREGRPPAYLSFLRR